MARSSQGSHHEGQGDLLSQERACVFPSATLPLVAFSGHEVTDLLSGPPGAFPNTCSPGRNFIHPCCPNWGAALPPSWKGFCRLCWVRSRKDEISENTSQLLLRESFLGTINFRVFKRVPHGEDRCALELSEGPAASGTVSLSSSLLVPASLGCYAVWAPRPPSSLLRDVCLP